MKVSDINFKQRCLVIMIFISPFFTLHVYGQLTQPKYGGFFHAPTLNNKQWFFSQTKVLHPLSSSAGKATIEIYLDKDIDNDGLPDLGSPYYLRNNFRYVQSPNVVRLVLISVKMESAQGTSVEYFMPDDNIVRIYDTNLNSQYSITDQNLWYRLSKVAPFQTVRAIESLPILFEIPKSKRKEDAVFQVKYFTRYRGFDKFDFSKVSNYTVYPCEWDYYNGLPLSSVWWLNKANDNILGPEFPNDYIKSTEPVSFPQIVWRNEELTNESSVAEYRFSWCGDGVLSQSETFSNGTFSEECDPNDPNKNNWGPNGCDCNCKKIIKAVSNKPKVWAVCVGISDYAQELNNQGLTDLTFSHIDAEQVFSFLKSAEGGAVPSNQISLLINSNATKENILQECNRIFQQAAEDDLIIFYFSGHGGENLFCAYDASIGHNDLKNIIYTSKAKKKLCVADACHAGSWNKNSTYASKALNRNQTANMYYEALGNSGDGIALFMASQTNEISVDDRELKQGLFTYYYLDGLKGNADANYDRIITLQELYDYVKKKVSIRGLAKWNNPQNPVLNGTFDHNMPVGVRSN